MARNRFLIGSSWIAALRRFLLLALRVAMLVSLQAASELRGRTTHRSHKTPIPGALPTVTTRLRARRQKPVELLADAQLVRLRRPRIVVRREI